MRAFAVRTFGEAPALYDLPIPSADSAFLICVKYAGINPLDNILAAGIPGGMGAKRRGRWYGFCSEFKMNCAFDGIVR